MDAMDVSGKMQYDFVVKIIIIGDSAVGKTCLLFRFSDEGFHNNYISTIGIDFRIKTVEIEGKKIKLQLWDTAGQERYNTITTSYYHGASGIMLVYDITNLKTFENLSRWLEKIDEHASQDVDKMILGNKCDLEDFRQVPRDHGQQIAEMRGIPFLETSAKCGIMAETAFLDLTRTIVKKLSSNGLPTNKSRNIRNTSQKLLHKSNCCS